VSLGITLDQVVKSARACDVRPDGVFGSGSSLNHWAAGGSVQRECPPAPGSGRPGGWLRILSTRVARGPFVLAGSVVCSWTIPSHWAAGESVQRLPPSGPGSAGWGVG
jgi:hypothetical protein